MKHKHLLLFGCAIAMTACSSGSPQIKDGQYWQRISASEATYLQGPKAQQVLNRDIGRCVVELRELESLGTIKGAIPTDHDGRVLGPDDRELYDWDQPERDQHLLAEHGDFHDFESCMYDKGWERIKYVPFDVAQRAEMNYYRAHVEHDYKPRTKKHIDPYRKNSTDFDDLND